MTGFQLCFELRFEHSDQLNSQEQMLHPWVKVDQAVSPLRQKQHIFFEGLMLKLIPYTLP